MVTDVQGVEVARLRAKDAQAFRSLIERLQQPITGYLHRLVGDREVALDLAQDTFLQVYKEIEKTSLDLALDAWIYRIATNYGLQYLNRQRLRKFIRFSRGADHSTDEHSAVYVPGTMTRSDLLTLASMVPSLEEQAETRLLIQQALASLNPKDAVCLLLHYGDGFTYDQIGNIIESSPEAVRKRVARSVEKFREVYRRLSTTLPVAGQHTELRSASEKKRRER